MTKSVKLKIILVLTTVALFAVSALFFGFVNGVDSFAMGNTQAFYLSEDRYTAGFWYNGENGLKTNPDLDRNYGKDGLVLFLHWLRQNGQQNLDYEFLNDFTNDTGIYLNGEKANYVEYPSYVSGIRGNILSDDFTYWMNTPSVYSTKIRQDKNPLTAMPIEGTTHGGVEYTYSHGGVSASAVPFEFNIDLNDDEWHVFSYYVGYPYSHKYQGYDEQWIRIYDPDGNLLTEHLVKDVNAGAYVRFVVKGSFVVSFSSGSMSAYSLGMFFDPYVYNAEIEPHNLNVELEGAKIVNLSWENSSDDSYTSVYRREKGDVLWQFIAETDKGITSYRDESAAVSTTYEYVLTSSLERITALDDSRTYTNLDPVFNQPEIRIKTTNLPDFTALREITTAPYKPTRIEFADSSYGTVENEELTVKVVLYKTDNLTDYVVFPDINVKIRLEGVSVASKIGINVYPNMDDYFGDGITDENGEVSISGTIPYAGQYNLVAYIDAQPNFGDEMHGYDSSETSVGVSVLEEQDLAKKPVIYSITDAVKPGETFSLLGYNLANDGALKIAYIETSGNGSAEYDPSENYHYITDKDIIFDDDLNGTGIMLVLPKSVRAGMYDFYVGNQYGWSNAITLNAPRPLYLDKDGAYAGQEVQIVGRNFMRSEYGADTVADSFSKLKVRLTLIKDENGDPVDDGTYYTLTERNGGILTGIKTTAENALQFENDALTAEDIPYTYSLRITIKIPEIYNYGTYTVSVSSDGEYFATSKECNELTIYAKKAQSWNTEIFGPTGNLHVGNDPLDLGVYWAQDLNYTDIVRMNENTFENAKEYTAILNTRIKTLSDNGGGVIYFPEGTYYLYSGVSLAKDVMLLGAGTDKTTFVYANNETINTIWFTSTRQDNIGIARVNLDATDARLYGDYAGVAGYYAPKYFVKWDGDGSFGRDVSTKNKFITDVAGNLVGGKTVDVSKCPRTIAVSGKNFVMRNCDLTGTYMYTELSYFGSLYNCKFVFTEPVETSFHWMGKFCFMENCYVDMQYKGHGPSLKSDQYIAYTFSSHTGDRGNPTNDGEALLLEAPSGMFSTGYVLDSTPRTITLNFQGGIKIFENTAIRFNMCGVYISEGKGAGQFRYINTAGTGTYQNCYELVDWEKEWDVLPDSSSIFACLAPLCNTTVYHFKAYDCVSSVCIYGNHIDTVIDGCTLVDTAGISGGGLASGGMIGGRINPWINIRIVNNEITGVAPHYNQSGYKATVGQKGGIEIYSGGSGDYMGMLTCGAVVKNNYIHDTVRTNMSGEIKDGFGAGLVFWFRGGQNNNANNARYVIFENNVLDNTEAGIAVDRTFTGVIVRNNDVSRTVQNEKDISIDRPIGFNGSAYHTLYIGGVISELSGEYVFESELPEIASEDGRVFVGWSENEDADVNADIITAAYCRNITLYAVFGREVRLDYNYVKSDNTQKGTYAVIRVVENKSAKSDIEDYGDPFRMGYEFDGWYLDRDCTVKYETDSAVNSNTTLYAKWYREGEIPSQSAEPTGTKSGVGTLAIIIAAVCGLLSVSAIIGTTVVIKKKK